MASTHFSEIPKPDPGPTGTGAAMRAEGLNNKTVQSTVTGGSVSLQGSMNGTDWATIGSAFTAPGFAQVPETVKFLRMSVATDIGAGKLLLGYDTDA